MNRKTTVYLNLRLRTRRLEYSPMLDLYRFKDCWVKGDVTFRVTNPETMEFEMTASSFGTGYLYNGQVEVVATVLGENNKFNPETNTLYFAYQMDVPACRVHHRSACHPFFASVRCAVCHIVRARAVPHSRPSAAGCSPLSAACRRRLRFRNPLPALPTPP